MPLGLGLASSHAPAIFCKPEDWPTVYDAIPEYMKGSQPHTAKGETMEVIRSYVARIEAAFATLRGQLEAYRPDALIIIGDDQGDVFDVSNMPNLAVFTGPEVWGAAKPFYVEQPELYGEICKRIIARCRQHPHFNPDKMHFVCGGWAINGREWNTKVDAAAEGHSLISVAPYLLHDLDMYDSPEARYSALFAYVGAHTSPFDGSQSTFDGLRKNGKGTGMAIYELNTHLTGGKAPASVASEMCPSVAAGVAVLDQALSYMSRFGANPINYYTYFQHSFGRGDQERVGLWGNLILAQGGEHRPRPVWLGLCLANRFLISGDLVEAQLVDIPTWDQLQNGRIPAIKDVPYIHAYAFLTTAPNSSRRQINLLLVNRHRTEALSVRVQLPFEPTDRATRVALTGAQLNDNNERAENVKLTEPAETPFSNGTAIELPPFSAVVLQCVEAG